MVVAAPPKSTLTGRWDDFYNGPHDTGRPHMRTYDHKFSESYKEPYVPPRPGKAPSLPTEPSLTWGIGGTANGGRRRLEPPRAADMANSQKRFLAPPEAIEMASGEDMGRKGVPSRAEI